jgi:hypothetical protein
VFSFEVAQLLMHENRDGEGWGLEEKCLKEFLPKFQFGNAIACETAVSREVQLHPKVGSQTGV